VRRGPLVNRASEFVARTMCSGSAAVNIVRRIEVDLTARRTVWGRTGMVAEPAEVLALQKVV
jgi:hypothetical protein